MVLPHSTRSRLLYHDSTSFYFTVHYSTMAVLHCTLLDIILPILYFTLLYSTLSTMALLHSTLVYISLPWLSFTLLYSTLLYHGSTSLYHTLHYSIIALLHSTLLYITLPWLYFTLLDSTILYHGSTSLY